MKQVSIILTAIFMLVIISCSGKDENVENFTDTYKEILLIWGRYQDSAVAVPKVRQAIKKHGYTQQSFSKAYFELARDPQAFMQILDSARARADRELNKQKEKYRRE